MKPVIRILSNLDEFMSFRDHWDQFIDKECRNPFFLSGFIKQFIQLKRHTGWTPQLLVLSHANEIIGLAPIAMKSWHGVRLTSFLLDPVNSPDLIIAERFKEVCLSSILNFLLTKSHLTSLTWSAQSTNVQAFWQLCQAQRIHSSITQSPGHYILHVDSTWDTYLARRGSNFRNRFKKIKRRLNRSGPWNIVFYENDVMPDLFQHVMEIEQQSWKQRWRSQKSILADQKLILLWKGIQERYPLSSNFKWGIWFLELESKVIAYSLMLQYKDLAIIVKTSYNEQYKSFYPGLYVNHVVIDDLFHTNTIKTIDFMTDLPFIRAWTKNHVPRYKIMISKTRLSNVVSLLRLMPLKSRISQFSDL